MRHCCTSVREGAGGVSYSYEILGVLCPSCEWEAEREYEEMVEADRRAALTQDQRDAEDRALRWKECYWRMQAIAGKFGCRQPGMPLKPGVWRCWASVPF
jgi:hypothetical protein